MQAENKRFNFSCEKCGLCCQGVARSQETVFLDRGDGVCKNYDTLTSLCNIYDERPDICRVESLYHKRYSKKYTWDEYVSINLRICHSLQESNIILKS